MGFLNENDSLAYFKIFGEFSSGLFFTVSVYRILSFLSLLVGFSGGMEERTSQHPNFLVGLRRPNIRRVIFWAFLAKFERHGDSRETLDRAHVKYVLPKGAFISTFVQKLGLIWLKVAFYFSYSGHKCNC